MSEQDEFLDEVTADVTETQTDEGSVVVPDDQTDDLLGEDPQAEVQRLKEQNQKLFERAKKAEGFVKTPEGTWVKKQPTATPQPTTNAGLSRDEAILIAQGMDAEDLDELKAVAQAKGLDLLKAKDTELFAGYLEKKQRDERKAKAQLSTSKGSNSSQPTPVGEMTKEEHQALFKKTMAEIR